MKARKVRLGFNISTLPVTALACGLAMLTGHPSNAGHLPCDMAATLDKKCTVAGGPWQDACEITAGQEVTYVYVVEITPPRAVFEVVDDKLGLIGQSSGNTLSRTVTLTETTTNIASMSVVEVDPECFLISYECCDALTVTVVTPTPTSTPTSSPTPTPTAVNTCAGLWPASKACTIGKGQSPSNNSKLSHCITGHIVNPSELGANAHRIPVCSGTRVDVTVTDTTGTPTNSSDGSLSCNASGCSGVVKAVEKYKSVSQDGRDTDRMTLIPN
jgi:hypothetical protein